jgi:cellulose synthase/poly-beta-1,6-N-acetylglucosamine synthase-like glycosyltransferase
LILSFLATDILDFIFVLFICIISMYLVRHYIFTLIVLRRSKINTATVNSLSSGYEPTVSILIPAHNEENVVGKLLQKTTTFSYPRSKLEILLIDDASSDNTGKIADEYAKSNQTIKVLHRNKAVGGKGKAAALNDGLKNSKGEIVLCFDADYLPSNDIVEKLVEKFVDPKVGAVQGRPVVLNEPQNIVTRLIALERIGGFRVDEEARDILGLVPQFEGTVGGFRRTIVEKLGGFDEAMLTEDTDLTFQIYLAGYKIRYAGDAECYEEAVDTWKAYWRQRHRWAKGHMQVCFKHSFNVLKTRKMSAKEKLDGLLLLFIYFMPLLTLASFFIGTLLVITGSAIAGLIWFVVPISLYSFVGNYAPFFEIGVGAYLDGRQRIQRLMPFLIFSFFYNILICTKAFFDLIIGKLVGGESDWEKTDHFGKGTLLTNSMEHRC